ncbi:SANT/Myb-like DNA-binding domain-containing protein [Streptomyces marokkonensis]|uniref:SANT/Myb-like DNA-binding domain-containing protein n=1 Tax=Streptomyces marokkonensis TaxID=324855 RepID=UPI003137D80B
MLAADLYYPGSLSLARKQAAASALSDWVRPADMRIAPQRKRWTEEEDRVLLRLNSDTDAASVLGRTEKSCLIRRWRLRNGSAPSTTSQ